MINQNKLIRVLKTVVASNDVWYHGRTTKSQKFDLDKTGKGYDQQGPGFYFSSDYDDAASYASPNGIVITAKIDIEDSLVPEEFREEDFETFVEHADPDELETSISNWPGGEGDLLEAITRDDVPYQAVWIEMFRNNPHKFLEAMVELGYDGHLAIPNATLETKHLIVYNPDVIDVQSVEDYKSER